MKSLFASLIILALVGAAPETPAPAPTATPVGYVNPHTYDDPAMHFEAPADYIFGGKQEVDSTKIDGPTVVAIWGKFPGQANQRVLKITIEPYEGKDVTGYEVSTENGLRGKIDGVFIGSKAPMTLTNGMPAYFMSITAGSGFNAMKIYQVIWFDGLRGVALSLSGRLGELTEAEARATLKNASAVRYPRGRL
ncbi:MAG: hypothetical protein M3R30_09280 [Candidatus Eremiobacteraeota bacterium]|nr:hypothetical protein [Candidatus Eremiobacteraeota bacterium]